MPTFEDTPNYLGLGHLEHLTTPPPGLLEAVAPSAPPVPSAMTGSGDTILPQALEGVEAAETSTLKSSTPIRM